MSKLPPEFAALEPFSDWCLPLESQRNLRRVSLGFAEINAFAEAMLPQVEAICAHIDAHRAEDGSYDRESLNLFHMLLSLAEVAPAIESYDPEVEVVDGYDTRKFVPDETHKLRPAI
ncbi:hypothetical protein [Pararhodobacter sp.]|uniref:hypothetical protein n=1 Tax=Pararhodobacter sp. TaxID=2127056 RepID=UPI002B001BAB|nr:hypothetical protein [Pararhodobacter sp.]